MNNQDEIGRKLLDGQSVKEGNSFQEKKDALQSGFLAGVNILLEKTTGKIVHQNGTIEEGIFLNGHLVRGKKTLDNSVIEGDFDIGKLGLLKNGTVIYNNNPDIIYNIENLQLTSIFDKKTGIIFKGNFNNPTLEYSNRKLMDGEIIFPDGKIEKVKNGERIIDEFSFEQINQKMSDFKKAIEDKSSSINGFFRTLVDFLETHIRVSKIEEGKGKYFEVINILEDFNNRYNYFKNLEKPSKNDFLNFRTDINNFLNSMYFIRNVLPQDFYFHLNSLKIGLEYFVREINSFDID